MTAITTTKNNRPFTFFCYFRSCFCYRGNSARNKKLRSIGHHYHHGVSSSESQPFRKSAAVKSPNQQGISVTTPTGGSHQQHLKKSPSPSGVKTPPGSCPIGPKSTSSILSGKYLTNQAALMSVAQGLGDQSTATKTSRRAGVADKLVIAHFLWPAACSLANLKLLPAKLLPSRKGSIALAAHSGRYYCVLRVTGQ